LISHAVEDSLTRNESLLAVLPPYTEFVKNAPLLDPVTFDDGLNVGDPSFELLLHQSSSRFGAGDWI
jgi:hypothetical protein